VIGAENEQLGILQSRQALAMAKELGLDLVMVSQTANPPVCKIIDHGKFKYLSEKQQKEGKRKQLDVKGIKISPRIAEHDIQFLMKKAVGFLNEGHKVRILCQFKAREITHPELGRQKLEKMAEQVKDIASVERSPMLEGRQMAMVLNPKPQPTTGKTKQNAKAENKQDSGEEVQDNRVGEDNSTQVAQQPPVPPQEREAEATTGRGTDAVQG